MMKVATELFEQAGSYFGRIAVVVPESREALARIFAALAHPHGVNTTSSPTSPTDGAGSASSIARNTNDQYNVRHWRMDSPAGIPRVGHLHITVDDLPWWWAETGNNNTRSRSPRKSVTRMRRRGRLSDRVNV